MSRQRVRDAFAAYPTEGDELLANEGASLDQLRGGEGSDSLGIACDEAAVVADLAQVIREVHRELH